MEYLSPVVVVVKKVLKVGCFSCKLGLSSRFWQMHMERFTKKIVTLMKSENLFETQGGPIILSQVLLLSLQHCTSFSLLFLL